MSNVSNFGTGQYSVSLPFLPASGTQPVLTGRLVLGADSYIIYAIAPVGSAIAALWYTDISNGEAAPLTGSAPISLTQSGIFSVSGSFMSVS